MNILEKYTICNDIGIGSFGSVKLAKHKLTGVLAAIKTGDNLAHECTILQWLKWTQYVPKLKWYSPSIAIMEYVGIPINKTLNTFSISQSIEWLRQLVSILEDIHNYGLLHRDIKPHNITIHPQNCRVYLIDFGISGLLCNQKPLHGVIGSPNYCSRTVHLREKLGRRDDIESAFYSCFFLDLYCDNDSETTTENNLMELKTAFLTKYTNTTDDFLRQTIVDIITLNVDDKPTYLGNT